MKHLVNGRQFVTLFYVEELNRFVDGLGNVVHDIFRLITPNQFMLFRKHKEMCQIKDTSNSFMVVLIYIKEGKMI
jgi:hypothetical protein